MTLPPSQRPQSPVVAPSPVSPTKTSRLPRMLAHPSRGAGPHAMATGASSVGGVLLLVTGGEGDATSTPVCHRTNLPWSIRPPLGRSSNTDRFPVPDHTRVQEFRNSVVLAWPELSPRPLRAQLLMHRVVHRLSRGSGGTCSERPRATLLLGVHLDHPQGRWQNGETSACPQIAQNRTPTVVDVRGSDSCH